MKTREDKQGIADARYFGLKSLVEKIRFCVKRSRHKSGFSELQVKPLVLERAEDALTIFGLIVDHMSSSQRAGAMRR